MSVICENKMYKYENSARTSQWMALASIGLCNFSPVGSRGWGAEWMANNSLSTAIGGSYEVITECGARAERGRCESELHSTEL